MIHLHANQSSRLIAGHSEPNGRRGEVPDGHRDDIRLGACVMVKLPLIGVETPLRSEKPCNDSERTMASSYFLDSRLRHRLLQVVGYGATDRLLHTFVNALRKQDKRPF